MLTREAMCSTRSSSVPTLREYGDSFYDAECDVDEMKVDFIGVDRLTDPVEDVSDLLQSELEGINEYIGNLH